MLDTVNNSNKEIKCACIIFTSKRQVKTKAQKDQILEVVKQRNCHMQMLICQPDLFPLYTGPFKIIAYLEYFLKFIALDFLLGA